MSGGSDNFEIAKKLAHNKAKVRTKAIRSLKALLSRDVPLTDAGMLKVWKGLFYCFWMSDKTAVQQELAENLASVVGHLDADRALTFFKAFQITMADIIIRTKASAARQQTRTV